MNLRDYQQQASDAIIRSFDESRTVLLCMPTGTGKTRVFADVILRMRPARSMVLAHRQELIWQAQDKIKLWTNLECQVEMADLKANENDMFGRPDVIIGTVQTQNTGPEKDRKRMSRFNPNDFGLLIIDECHHSTASSYLNVVNYYQQNPNLKVLGVTATPDRADEEALGKVFQAVAFDYEILDAIDNGWLVDIRQRCAKVAGLDYSGVRTTAGDLNGGDLAKVMEAEHNIQGVCQPTLEAMFRFQEHHLDSIPVTSWPSYLANQPAPRRTIMFTASKLQAERTCEVLNRSLPDKVAWVCDATPTEKRIAMLKDFQAGKLSVICNCGILTEGYDNPGVELIVMARATKSRCLYAQQCGRATRPLPGIVDGLATAAERVQAIRNSAKPACVILDFVGNSGKHKLVVTAELLGGKVSDGAVAASHRLIEKLEGEVSMRELLHKEQDKIDAHERIEKARLEEARRRALLVARVNYKTQAVNPFEILDLKPVRARSWDNNRVLSEKQSSLLRKQGIDPDQFTYTECRQMIGEMFRRWDGKLCSFKQAKILKRYGYDTGMTRDMAHEVLDKLAANNWRRL